jgi:hypothetical protein
MIKDIMTSNIYLREIVSDETGESYFDCKIFTDGYLESSSSANSPDLALQEAFNKMYEHKKSVGFKE